MAREKQSKDSLEKFGLKVIDKLEKIPEIAMQGGVAYVGARAANHWTGGIVGLIGLKLAQAPNLFAPLAGLTILSALGLSVMVNRDGETEDPPVIDTPGLDLFPTEGEVVITTPANCLSLGGTILPRFTPGGLIQCELPHVPPPPADPIGGECPVGYYWEPTLGRCVRERFLE